MEPDLSPLDEFLAGRGADGYLFESAGDDSDHRYVSGFDAPDPFVTLYTPDGVHILTKELEYGRAVAESRADTVTRHSDLESAGSDGGFDGYVRIVVEFLADHGVESLIVPQRFPAATADGLREEGLDVTAEVEGPVTAVRAIKTEEEIEWIRASQAANEEALATVERVLREANVDGDVLRWDGDVLTSERVKTELEKTLLEERCGLDEAIVAGGSDAAEPHNRGSGPLPAGEPVVVDIFPRSKATKYHGDVTRTFVKGEPSDAARELYELTEAAFDAALDALEPGATGAEVHGAACDVYEEAGYPTLRSEPGAETGFIHSTGHGIGLDVHEEPGVNDRNERPLEPGHVVTIEPGLYDPDVGGVRIEDLVVVTGDGGERAGAAERGYRNLTDYPVEFVLE